MFRRSMVVESTAIIIRIDKSTHLWVGMVGGDCIDSFWMLRLFARIFQPVW